MRALKVVFAYCSKEAGVSSFIVGFYLVFILQGLTGITGSNIQNALLVLISAMCGYISYKMLLNFPIKEFEEESEKGKLEGFDLYLVWAIAAILLAVLIYFNPSSAGESEYLRNK